MAIYISVITGILLFFLTYLIDNHLLTAFLAFIIYSTVNVYLLISRYALIENLLIPLTLISLIFLVLSKRKWRKFKNYLKPGFLVLAGISAGLALATKELGIAVIITGVLILLIYKVSPKNILFFFVPALVLGLSYYLYALIISPQLFFDIFINQVSRGFFGSLNFLYSFYRPHFAGFPLEGWWVFGFICLLFLRENLKKYREIVIAFLCYLLVFLFFGGVNHPWYSLVFVPFMIIASAIFIKKLLLDPTAMRLIIFFLFPFSSSLYWGHYVFRQSSANVLVYRFFILFFLSLITLSVLRKKVPVVKVIISIALLIILFKIYQWNQYGFTYLIANWGNLPENFFLRL
jgi:4-amino-4-deoxy-L-arabinose transferase-like glycosyltransferase